VGASRRERFRSVVKGLDVFNFEEVIAPIIEWTGRDAVTAQLRRKVHRSFEIINDLLTFLCNLRGE
jgi:hypothetical protein